MTGISWQLNTTDLVDIHLNGNHVNEYVEQATFRLPFRLQGWVCRTI